MSDLKISLVQTEQFWEDKEANLRHFESLLKRDIQEPTDVIVFPEMFHTGFTMSAKNLAETISSSMGIGWLKKIAMHYRALCLGSLIIEENGAFFNRMVAVFPEGHFETYDKVHLFTLAGEDKSYSPGNSSTVIEYKGWKIALQICYDLRFPENARNFIDEKGEAYYDVIVYVANWPEKRIAHWNKLLPARAIENQSYVLAVNRVGKDDNNLSYNGSTQVLAADGSYIIDPQIDSQGIFSAELSKNELISYRNQLQFLKDRVK